MNKFNKKLKIILLLCFIISVTIPITIFNLQKKMIEPKETVSIPVYANDLDIDTEIESTDIDFISIEMKYVPSEAIQDEYDVIGKRVLNKVYKGEYIISDEISERGVSKVENTQDMFKFGIDVVNISDFLGVQLKLGEKYLAFNKPDGAEPSVIGEIIVVGLVDNSGNEISEMSAVTPKTINIAVESIEVAQNIMDAEKIKSIEFVKAPLDYVYEPNNFEKIVEPKVSEKEILNAENN